MSALPTINTLTGKQPKTPKKSKTPEMNSDTPPVHVTKMNIPNALREQVWLQSIGNYYKSKCYVKWCKNSITVFDFHVGHNIPESKGGLTVLENLLPICSRCNLSMSNNYSIDEWNKLGNKKICCFPFL